MWRAGTGHRAQRSTGSRKHAADGARMGAHHKLGKSIIPDQPTGTRREEKRMEAIQRRAEVRHQLIEQREENQTQRLLITERRQQRNEHPLDSQHSPFAEWIPLSPFCSSG